MSSIKRRHTYTKEEIQFMYDNHKNMTSAEIAIALGLEITSTRAKLFSLGLKTKTKNIYSEDGTLKRCSKCKEYLPLDNFGTHTGKPRSQCRKCEYNNPNATKSSKRVYSDEDNEFLINYSKDYTYKELADIFNVSDSAIRGKMYSMRLKAKTRQAYSEDRTMKRCSRCDKMFPIEEYTRPNSKGIKSACRACLYEYHFNRKNQAVFIKKPTFDELIKRTRHGVRYCTHCKQQLTESNSVIRYSSSKYIWEIATNCKPCANEKHKQRTLKRIAERGY